MNSAPIYLLSRFFFRISDFLHHWYLDGSKYFWHGAISFFENLDKTFALKITLRYFWKPLYGDYTIVGHILGFFFRSARILIGAATYTICALVIILIYIAWASLPFVLLLMSYRSYITTS